VRTSAAWLASELSARAHRPRRPSTDRARRAHGDRGEGVISAAIAVLIMAFLGAAMWVGFNTMWTGTQQNVCTQLEEIGDGGADIC
jgi:hypothetical protein